MKKINLILLVDDDLPTNFLHEMLILENGLAEKIDIVNTGSEAIDYLSTKIKGQYPCPDIIFLDINMPIMNGWQFLQAYKELPEDQKANIVIIMLTTSLNPDDNKRAKEIEDVREFITKPLTIEKYKELLERFFE